MSFTPLSLSEVHRRRAMRLSSFSVQSATHMEAEYTEMEDDEEQL
jgi:hypothetical protein